MVICFIVLDDFRGIPWCEGPCCIDSLVVSSEFLELLSASYRLPAEATISSFRAC